MISMVITGQKQRDQLNQGLACIGQGLQIKEQPFINFWGRNMQKNVSFQQFQGMDSFLIPLIDLGLHFLDFSILKNYVLSSFWNNWFDCPLVLLKTFLLNFLLPLLFTSISFTLQDHISKIFIISFFCSLIFLFILFYLYAMAQSRNNKTHYDHLINLKTKLEYVDRHIRRSENLPPSFFMQPQLLMHITKQKNHLEPILQMELNSPKTFLLHQQPLVKFYFQYTEISSEKKFCLRVSPSKAEIQIQMQIEGSRKKYFYLSTSKALIIEQENWKSANFALRGKKLDKLSVVKVEIDTIIIDHKVKIHGVPSQRKIVEKELKQYLKNNMNRDKINEILEKRRRKSFTRGTSLGGRVNSADKTSNSFYNVQSYASARIFRNSAGFSQSTSLRNKEKIVQQARVRTTMERKRVNQFQKSKKLYLNHLQKMSPEKYHQIMEQQKNYHLQKKEAGKNISKITMALVFMYKTLRVCVEGSKNKIRKIKIRMLCKKFIKNLIHANKMRLTFKNRYKASFSLNLALLGNFFYEQSREKAVHHIISSTQKQCFKQDVMNIVKLSVKYESAVKVLQRNFKFNRALFLHRFEQLAIKIKGYKFESKEQLLSVYKKYKQFCYSKSKRLKYGFTKYHKRIDQIMKQNIQQKLKY